MDAERLVALIGRERALALLGRWAEPHRRYHSLEHLAECLIAFTELGDLAADPLAVELAVWYHDAVYDPAAAPGRNEVASADLAAEELTELAVMDEVVRLVLLTAGHAVAAGDANGAVMADIDLHILGATPVRYARYAADVRAEYAHVPDDGWVAGRSAVLEGFLARPRIFRTDRAHGALDANARRNLATELAALRGAQP